MPDYTEDDYPRDAGPEDWPFVPEEGDTAQFGTYSVDVHEIDTEHRRAIVEPRTASITWRGWVSLWMLADEEFDRDVYPWMDAARPPGVGDDDDSVDEDDDDPVDEDDDDNVDGDDDMIGDVGGGEV